MDLMNLIKKQRAESQKEAWKGTLAEYLQVLKDDPDTAKLAARRLYDSIASFGVESMQESDPRCKKLFDSDKLKIYDYFKNDFYGHERVIAKIMRFLKSASMKGEESRQVLLLMGPVGSGKSALADSVKRALEKAADAVYHLEGCPVREEPLHLLPRSLRDDFEKALGVHIEGDQIGRAHV